MKRIIRLSITILVIFILYLNSPFPSEASREISITSDKLTLLGDEEMNVSASPSGFTDGETIYIKGAFYQEGFTNYFGFTKYNDNWVKNGESTLNQRQIKIREWDGYLTVKNDFTDSGYKGNGEYKFKVGFYYTTSGGNLSSVNWSSNSLSLNIIAPSPTQTPIPTSMPSSTPNPTNTPTPPTSPPSPSTKLPLATKTPVTPKVYGESNILGDSNVKVNSDSKNPSITPQDMKLQAENQKSIDLAKILIIVGVAMIGGSTLWLFIKTKRHKGLNLHS